MKKNPILYVMLFSSLCLASCGQKQQIKLVGFSGEQSIHTELQQYYLDNMFNGAYQPNEATDDVKGTEELSRPNPVKLQWEYKGNDKNYVVSISEHEDFTDTIEITSEKEEVDVYNLKIGTKYYWKVANKTETSKVNTFNIESDGPRNLFIDGITNVRDVGGWMSSSNKMVAQGLIYRGARLNQSYATGHEAEYLEPTEVIPEITEEGKKVFSNFLGIKTEVDFRIDARNGYPAGTELKSVVEGVKYVALPMSGSGPMITDGNEKNIKALMELLANKSNYPVYIHCNIGTDRTGMVSYLLNALCGVDDDSLLKDYLFSNFGKIGELKSPSNNKNTWFGLSAYTGDTLQERAENYFTSIGVSEATYTAVRDILLAE